MKLTNYHSTYSMIKKREWGFNFIIHGQYFEYDTLYHTFIYLFIYFITSPFVVFFLEQLRACCKTCAKGRGNAWNSAQSFMHDISKLYAFCSLGFVFVQETVRLALFSMWTIFMYSFIFCNMIISVFLGREYDEENERRTKVSRNAPYWQQVLFILVR